MKPSDPLVFRLLKFYEYFVNEDLTLGVMLYLIEVANRQNEILNTPCTASHKTLAKKMRVSTRSIIRYQNQSKKMGLINVENKFHKKHQKSNHVLINQNAINQVLKINRKLDTENLSPLGVKINTNYSDNLSHNNTNNKTTYNYTNKNKINRNQLSEKKLNYIHFLAKTYQPKDPTYEIPWLEKQLKVYMSLDRENQTEANWNKLGTGINYDVIMQKR
tara:strand:+ start:1459 stop:2112 length:654 start_codon:yes stop_codon:yes gene_type:complete